MYLWTLLDALELIMLVNLDTWTLARLSERSWTGAGVGSLVMCRPFSSMYSVKLGINTHKSRQHGIVVIDKLALAGYDLQCGSHVGSQHCKEQLAAHATLQLLQTVRFVSERLRHPT